MVILARINLHETAARLGGGAEFECNITQLARLDNAAYYGALGVSRTRAFCAVAARRLAFRYRFVRFLT